MKNEKVSQSLENFYDALHSLEEAISKSSLTNLELAGAIQNFEFSYELAWKTLQKYASSEGRKIVTPREAFQYAREADFVENEKLWLDMIEDRNETVHTYDHESAVRVYKEVKERYFPALLDLYNQLLSLK